VPNDTDRIIGSRIRFMRIARELSQQTVAGALGVSFQQIQKYEKGVNRISASKLYDLARLFNASVEAFFADLDRPSENGFIMLERELYTNPQVIRLAKAFDTIKNDETKKNVLRLVLSMTEPEQSASAA